MIEPKIRSAEVGAAIWRIARRGGVQQKDLAAAIGVTPAAMNNKIAGTRPITLEELELIAKRLGKSEVELLPKGWIRRWEKLREVANA